MDDLGLILLIGAGAALVYWISTPAGQQALKQLQSAMPQPNTLTPPPAPGAQAPLQPGVTNGTTANGVRYQYMSSGAIQVWPVDPSEGGTPEIFSGSMAVGPAGQTISQLVTEGWSYANIADYLVMSGQGQSAGAAQSGPQVCQLQSIGQQLGVL
jgi:hypothetical protein